MLTISRANRVFEDKQSGMIVDYYGILRKLNEALVIYGSGTGGGTQEGDAPLRQVTGRLAGEELETHGEILQGIRDRPTENSTS